MNTTTFPPAPSQEPAGPWLMQVPVVCTQHFTEEEAALCHQRALLQDPEGRSCLLLIEECGDPHPVVQYFIQLGYRYLRLDPDAAAVAGFPVHQW